MEPGPGLRAAFALAVVAVLAEHSRLGSVSNRNSSPQLWRRGAREPEVTLPAARSPVPGEAAPPGRPRGLSHASSKGTNLAPRALLSPLAPILAPPPRPLLVACEFGGVGWGRNIRSTTASHLTFCLTKEHVSHFLEGKKQHVG